MRAMSQPGLKPVPGTGGNVAALPRALRGARDAKATP